MRWIRNLVPVADPVKRGMVIEASDEPFEMESAAN